MRLSFNALAIPKLGEGSPSKDAHAIEGALGGIGIRAAIADGATESGFSGIWASLLVDRFITSPFLDLGSLDEARRELALKWRERVETLATSWHARIKLSEGAHATFLGLELEQDGTWRALAVGDACAFQVRRGELLAALPIESPDAFGSRPSLVESAYPCLPDMAGLFEGRWEPGDAFFLATDSVAHYILTSLHSGNSPWDELSALWDRRHPSRAFFTWARHEHGHGRLRNDDLTLMRIIPDEACA